MHAEILISAMTNNLLFANLQDGVRALYTYCHSRNFKYNRPFATNDHMVHGGGQAHYYFRTGTSKQRQAKLHWFRSLCFNVPVPE